MKTAFPATMYPLEPLMHGGKAYVPGEPFEVSNEDDCASILLAGRGTLITEDGKAAAKIYQDRQKAAAAAAQATPAVGIAEFNAAVAAAVAAALPAQKQVK